MKPMLAHPYELKRFRTPCIVQPKLNGVRALWQRGIGFMSRDEIKWPEGKLRHLEDELISLDLPPLTILDGELYLHGLSLQKINQAIAIKSPKITERTQQIQYHVFDVPDEDRCFSVRYFAIAQLLGAEGKMIRPVLTQRIYSHQQAEHYYSKYVGLGYEGMMYKFDDHGYTQPKKDADKDNRTFYMLKRKDWQDDDYLIIGLNEGRPTDLGSKYVGTLGAFVCRSLSGKTFTVGSGISDEERDLYWADPDSVIGKKIKVKYLCLSDEGVPLNPTILAIDV